MHMERGGDRRFIQHRQILNYLGSSIISYIPRIEINWIWLYVWHFLSLPVIITPRKPNATHTHKINDRGVVVCSFKVNGHKDDHSNWSNDFLFPRKARRVKFVFCCCCMPFQQGAALLLGQRDPEFGCIVGGCGACWRFILWLATVVVVGGWLSGNKDVN